MTTIRWASLTNLAEKYAPTRSSVHSVEKDTATACNTFSETQSNVSVEKYNEKYGVHALSSTRKGELSLVDCQSPGSRMIDSDSDSSSTVVIATRRISNVRAPMTPTVPIWTITEVA